MRLSAIHIQCVLNYVLRETSFYAKNGIPVLTFPEIFDGDLLRQSSVKITRGWGGDAQNT